MKKTTQQSHYLWFLILSYTITLVLANWFNPRLIQLFGLNTDAGTLIFPLTFILGNIITEVYGYKQARLAIWIGFLFCVIFIFYGQLIVNLPSPEFATYNPMFNQIFTLSSRMIVASLISYLIAETINTQLVARLKVKLHGKYMGGRFVFSTLLAAGLDSFVFGFIAFYGIIATEHLLTLILTMWFLKVLIEILLLPISIKLTKKLRDIEQLDVYDKETKFKLFSLDTDYR